MCNFKCCVTNQQLRKTRLISAGGTLMLLSGVRKPLVLVKLKAMSVVEVAGVYRLVSL